MSGLLAEWAGADSGEGSWTRVDFGADSVISFSGTDSGISFSRTDSGISFSRMDSGVSFLEQTLGFHSLQRTQELISLERTLDMGTEEWSDSLEPTDMRGGHANFYVISALLDTAFQARGQAGDIAFLDRGIVGYSGMAAMMVGDNGGSLTRTYSRVDSGPAETRELGMVSL